MRSNDDWDDDSIPTLETVISKPDPTPAPIPFFNGISHSEENGDGFIKDDYCGDEVERRRGPLPSRQLTSSGPESDFGPVFRLVKKSFFKHEVLLLLLINIVIFNIFISWFACLPFKICNWRKFVLFNWIIFCTPAGS